MLFSIYLLACTSELDDKTAATVKETVSTEKKETKSGGGSNLGKGMIISSF